MSATPLSCGGNSRGALQCHGVLPERGQRLTSQLLLIDDDLRLTDMVGGYLRQNGFEVDTAGSLAAGRERLKQVNYDALLLDLMLPDGDGLDFTRELRSQPRTRGLPLLMLTARGEPMAALQILAIPLGIAVVCALPSGRIHRFHHVPKPLRRQYYSPPSCLRAHT